MRRVEMLVLRDGRPLTLCLVGRIFSACALGLMTQASSLHAQTLRPVVTIPGPDGPELGSVRSVSADATGKIYVADESASQVFVFSAAGGFVRRIGKTGSGPGEFKRLYGALPFGDGLVTLDAGNARIEFFDRGLEPKKTIRWVPLTGPASVIRLFQATATEIWVRRFSHYVKVQQTGLGDSIKIPPGRGQNVQCEIANGIRFFDVPFAPMSFAVPASGGMLARANSDSNVVRFVDSGQNVNRSVRLDLEARVVTKRQWDSAAAEYVAFRAENSGIRCTPRQMPRYSRWPNVSGLYFDDVGNLFVETALSEGSTWTVYDGRGKRLSRFRTPVRDSRVPPYMRGESIYLVMTDIDDVQRVESFKWR
jgi:DNA-binding beta-propeller fold protein YncE